MYKYRSPLIVLVVIGILYFGRAIIIKSNTSPEPAVTATTETAQQEPAPEPVPPSTLTLAAVGDIMTSRVVGQKMVAKGFDYPFAKTIQLFADKDLVFANLETPIIEGPQVDTGTMVFRSDPEVAPALKAAGFDVLSLANNHTMNKGSAGILRTFEILQEAGLQWVGSGKNEAEARAPLIVERNGISIAFLAYTDTDVVPATYAATAEKPGNAFMIIEDLQADVAAIRSQVDFVIVTMHSGTEYVVEPNARQTAFAHAAIDSGADIIIAQHPHVVQRAEIYNDKLIFYSLGNFIFDQMWSQDTREGLVIFLTFTKDGDTRSIAVNELIPVQIDDYSQPHVIEDAAQKTRILERLGDYQLVLDFSN